MAAKAPNALALTTPPDLIEGGEPAGGAVGVSRRTRESTRPFEVPPMSAT